MASFLLMNQEEWLAKLKEEGFRNFTISINEPDFSFPEHIHTTDTVHILLDGELALIQAGNIVAMTPGDRFDIPAGTIHSAKCGSKGCRFIVGEK